MISAHARRRTLSLAAAATVAMLSITGCAGSASDSPAVAGDANRCTTSDGNKTVTVWTFLNPGQATDTRSKALRQIIDTFQATHPGVSIDVVTQDWTQLQTKYLTSVATNNEPDILWSLQTDAATLSQKGTVADLRDLLGSSYIADLEGKLATPGTEVKGQLAQLPIWPDAGLVNYYRTDQLQKAGLSAPPQTWDEFAAAAAKVSQQGNGKTVGFGVQSTGSAVSSFFFNVVSGQGTSAWNQAWKDGKFNFTGPEAKKAAETIRDLVVSGAVPRDNGNLNGESEQNQFVTGRYAIANMISTRLTTIKGQASANFDASTIKVAGLPTADAGGKSPYITNSWGLVASKSPASPDCTAAFLQALYTPESALTWSKVGGQLPILKSTSDDPWFKTSEAADVNEVASVIKNGIAIKLPSDIVNITQTMNAANGALQTIITDPSSNIDQVLEQAQRSAYP